MKILYIAHNHPPEDAPLESVGGMQRVSMQLVGELERRDDIELKTIIQHVAWEKIERYTVSFLIKLAINLPAEVQKFKPDVILFSSMVTASVAFFTRSRIDVPMVTINHGQDVTLPVKIYQKFIPRVFKALDGVISVSSATREQCMLRGMDAGKGRALPNGFNLDEFEVKTDKEEARKKIAELFDIDLQNNKLLITVGRQVKRKGHAWFMEEVLPKVNSKVVYLAIGDGPQFENLRELRERLDNKDQIILAGRQPDEVLGYAYAAADLFMMPNVPVPGDMEGFGIVILEANMAGTPAIASDLEGIKDVITPGENGYKIPVKDADTFARKTDEVLNGELSELSTKAREFVMQNFGWKKVTQRYIDFLNEVKQNCSR